MDTKRRTGKIVVDLHNFLHEMSHEERLEVFRDMTVLDIDKTEIPGKAVYYVECRHFADWDQRYNPPTYEILMEKKGQGEFGPPTRTIRIVSESTVGGLI